MDREEREDGVRDARLALELVSALAADLVLKGGTLKPVTKTRLANALRDYKLDGYAAGSVERLRTALTQETPLDREEKRERPR